VITATGDSFMDQIDGPSLVKPAAWEKTGSRALIALLRAGGAGDRAAASAFAVDDLARAAPQRRDPRRSARVPGNDRAVAR
jgi:hypothetical protein